MTTPTPTAPRRRSMFDDLKPLLIFGGIFAAWFALNRWVLPRFGVQT